MFGFGLPELFALAALFAAIVGADRLAELAMRWGGGDFDRGARVDDLGSPHSPYRAADAPPVDPLVAEAARLRRALLVTRAVAVLAGLGAFGVGRFLATPMERAETRSPGQPPRPLPRAPLSDPLGGGWPFDPEQNPPARIGERFDYSSGAGGYQVPMRFDLPAQDPADVDAPLVSAALELDVHLRVIPGQTQGTEGIWIDGVLSGTTWPAFRVPGAIDHDLSGRNTVFTDTVTRCCRERLGHLSLALDALLRGSGRSVESLLADRRLDVVIDDDVEVYGAGLVLCRRGPVGERAPVCSTVAGRSLDAAR